MEALRPLYNILKSQLQTIENQRVLLNSVETESSQMPDLLCVKEMTPEQMKMNPIKRIIKVKTNEELDTEEGESNTHEQESTISNNDEDEYSTFSDMSKQDSESDINVDETQHQENPQTPQLQVYNTYNITIHNNDDLIHDENNTSENENIIEIETFEHYEEKIHETEESIPMETSQVLTVFNKTIHHEEIHQIINL